MITQNAFSYFPLWQSSEAKSKASLGMIGTQQTDSLLTNPALLNAEENNYEVHSSLAIVDLSYAHPKFERFHFRVATPIVSVGIKNNFDIEDRKINFGIYLIPMGIGAKDQLNGLPVDLAQDIAARFDVTQSKKAGAIIPGFSYHMSDDLVFGISLPTSIQSYHIEIYSHESGAEVVQGDWFAWHSHLLVGSLFKLSDQSFSVMASPPLIKGFKNESLEDKNSKDDAFVIRPSSKVEYKPLQFGMGYLWAMENNQEVSLEYFFEKWDSGRSVYKRGFGTSKADMNFINTHHFSLSYSRLLETQKKVYFGMRRLAGNLGDGRFPSNNDVSDHGLGGFQFGDIEGSTRYEIGSGLSWHLKDQSEISSGLRYSFSQRDVPLNHPWQGYYRTQIWEVLAGWQSCF